MVARSFAHAKLAGLAAVVAVVSACQTVPPSVKSQASQEVSPVLAKDHITFPAPLAWGGEARCSDTGCKVALVEHEAGQLVLHQFKGRSVVELDRKPLAYHPDSAKWITDDWVVAAVERGQSLDLFAVNEGRLTAHAQIGMPFAPRDVVVLGTENGVSSLMATPYSGQNVAIVRWQHGAKAAKVDPVQWCEAPWHPALVKRAPHGGGSGVIAACLDGKRVLFVSGKDWTAKPTELARFDRVARQAAPSPTGKWLYVALEIGPNSARINMDSGEVQYLQAAPNGAVSVAPLDDDAVVWGGPNSIYLQKFDAAGKVLETRWLKPSGYPTGLQLIDLDGDGEKDLLVLNSAGQVADVFYGPIWARALGSL